MRTLKYPNFPIKESFYSTAINLTGTTQFVEAKRSNYEGFEVKDLFARAKNIVQVQTYMIYQWSLIRFCIQHPVSERFIGLKYFNVTPKSFNPTDKEVKSYIDNPRFLWRFSIRNYNHFAKQFSKVLPMYHYNVDFNEDGLATSCDVDSSPLLEYVKPVKGSVKAKIKNKWYDNEAKSLYDLTFRKIDELERKFYYNCELSNFKMGECFHSDDFQLHLMGAAFDYKDFVQTIITGYTAFTGRGNLLKQAIALEQEKKDSAKSSKEWKKTIKIEKQEVHTLRKERSELAKLSKTVFNYHDDDQWKDDIFPIPTSAVRYLGTSGTKYDGLRLVHFNELVKRRKRVCKIQDLSHSFSSWAHKFLTQKVGYHDSLYFVAIEACGLQKASVTNTMRVDNDGVKSRVGWKPPCSDKFLKEKLRKYYYYELPELIPESYSQMPNMKLSSDGLLQLCDEAYNGNKFSVRVLTETARKTCLAPDNDTSKSNEIHYGSMSEYLNSLQAEGHKIDDLTKNKNKENLEENEYCCSALAIESEENATCHYDIVDNIIIEPDDSQPNMLKINPYVERDVHTSTMRNSNRNFLLGNFNKKDNNASMLADHNQIDGHVSLSRSLSKKFNTIVGKLDALKPTPKMYPIGKDEPFLDEQTGENKLLTSYYGLKDSSSESEDNRVGTYSTSTEDHDSRGSSLRRPNILNKTNISKYQSQNKDFAYANGNITTTNGVDNDADSDTFSVGNVRGNLTVRGDNILQRINTIKRKRYDDSWLNGRRFSNDSSKRENGINSNLDLFIKDNKSNKSNTEYIEPLECDSDQLSSENSRGRLTMRGNNKLRPNVLRNKIGNQTNIANEKESDGIPGYTPLQKMIIRGNRNEILKNNRVPLVRYRI